MLASVAAETVFTGAALIVIVALALVELALVVVCLVDIVRRPAVLGGRKWIWVVVVLLFNLVGPIVYLAIGRVSPPAQTTRLAIGKARATGRRPRPTCSTGAARTRPNRAKARPICRRSERGGARRRHRRSHQALRQGDRPRRRRPDRPRGLGLRLPGPQRRRQDDDAADPRRSGPSDGGRATVLGHDVVGEADAVHALIGFLPDVPGFYKWMTAEEFLVLSGRLFGLDHEVLRERVAALLDLAGLAGVTTRIGGYSRGMKQRLGVAQALINAPRLLMLDEPTSALDPIGRRELLEMIAGLAGRTTVFFSTHILADVERVCDTVAILARGRVVEQAAIDDLKARHGGGHRVVVEVDQPERLLAALRGSPWLATATRDGRELVLEVPDLETAFREVPAAVAAQGLALRRLEVAEVSLEEVFVDLVEGRRCRSPDWRKRPMTAFRVFLAKEFRETRKTWRLWVVPGILVFVGLTSPVSRRSRRPCCAPPRGAARASSSRFRSRSPETPTCSSSAT